MLRTWDVTGDRAEQLAVSLGSPLQVVPILQRVPHPGEVVRAELVGVPQPLHVVDAGEDGLSGLEQGEALHTDLDRVPDHLQGALLMGRFVLLLGVRLELLATAGDLLGDRPQTRCDVPGPGLSQLVRIRTLPDDRVHDGDAELTLDRLEPVPCVAEPFSELPYRFRVCPVERHDPLFVVSTAATRAAGSIGSTVRCAPWGEVPMSVHRRTVPLAARRPRGLEWRA